MPAQETRAVIFFGTWIVLCLVSWPFFLFSRNAALKRTVWRLFIPVVGALFVFFAWWIFGQTEMVLFVIVPAVALLTLLNLKSVKFCDRCSRTINGFPMIAPLRYCPSCGAALGGIGQPADDQG